MVDIAASPREQDAQPQQRLADRVVPRLGAAREVVERACAHRIHRGLLHRQLPLIGVGRCRRLLGAAKLDEQQLGELVKDLRRRVPAVGQLVEGGRTKLPELGRRRCARWCREVQVRLECAHRLEVPAALRQRGRTHQRQLASSQLRLACCAILQRTTRLDCSPVDHSLVHLVRRAASSDAHGLRFNRGGRGAGGTAGAAATSAAALALTPALALALALALVALSARIARSARSRRGGGACAHGYVPHILIVTIVLWKSRRCIRRLERLSLERLLLLLHLLCRRLLGCSLLSCHMPRHEQLEGRDQCGEPPSQPGAVRLSAMHVE
mmetsp:Transcript_48421/g.116460  ORF Transcript_48421/g.116460 Transcript_48421/m.116460 type:complete len:325 (+) Transcript_48421:1540-2514(+)|eukprot:scaffold122553_cov39-Phaeocystis_antarctica.AAC.2